MPIKATHPQRRAGLVGGVELNFSYSDVRASSVTITPTVSSGSIQSWDILYRRVGDTAWITYASGLSASSKTVGDLSPSTDSVLSQYEFRVIGRVLVEASATSRVATAIAPARFIRRRDLLIVTPQNGMFQDIEPVESGVNGIPIISGAGRTICSNYNRLMAPNRAAQHTAYGIRFLLGNPRLVPISGGKMIVGVSYGWNGNWTPRSITGIELNSVTGSVETGWERVTIGGDDSLPIPAADPGASILIRCVWSDWIQLPAINLGMADWDILTRVLVPPRSIAPYALTHANWGTIAYEHSGVLAGRNLMRAQWYAGAEAGMPTEYHLRAEGDYVSDPAAAGNIALVAGTCPSGDFVSSEYGPPGPAHTPILGVQYATSEAEVIA